MYHKSIGELMGKLKSRQLSQLAQFGYLCNYVILLTIIPWLEVVFLRSLFSQFASIELGIMTLGYLGLTIVSVLGFLAIYRMNRRGDNEEFLVRAICLSAYTLTWILCCLVLFGLVVWFTVNSLKLGSLAQSYVRNYFSAIMFDVSLGLTIFTWLAYLFGYLRVRSYVHYVSNKHR
jgi:hypothetical protein